MAPGQLALIGLAGFAAGAVNAIAGGGTLLSFPALLAVGLPAVAANVTSTIALCPGYLGATLAQRADLAGQRIRLLSLLPAATYEVLPVEGATIVNYGLNRVRFPAPVPAGSRVRISFRVESVDPVEGGVQVVLAATIECEGVRKPACVAGFVLRYLS